jgi:hypothetical protein
MVWAPIIAAIAMGQGGDPVAAEAASPAQPRVESPDFGPAVRVEDVEVRSRRGAALTLPEIELDAADIDALGVWDIGEVLTRMGETLGVGDQPLVLINGQLTPNAGVFSGFPPGALVRAEVLPPEAAALYGAAPGRRVVNLVLQPQFSSHDGRIVGSRPTQGGTSSLSGDVRRSAIAGRNTHQTSLRLSRDTALRRDERDQYLASEAPGDGRVTLRPRADDASATLALTRAIGAWSGAFSVSGQAEDSRSVVRLGDAYFDSRRRSGGLAASAGLSGRAAGWSVQANLVGRASSGEEEGPRDRRNETRSLSLTGAANRRLVDLPAGPVTAALSGAFMESRSSVDDDAVKATNRFHAQELRGSLAVPLAKADGPAATGGGLGDVLATVGAGARQARGGGGGDVDAALVWTPRARVRLTAAWSVAKEGVPDQQRAAPEYFGSPLVLFDFRTAEAVEVLPIRGGNPDLRAPETERLSLTASLGPFTAWGLSSNLSYQRVQSADAVGFLPELTEDVEAAFPERIRRGADGRLISVDYRPINLDSLLTESLGAGLNFQLPRPSGVAASEATVLRVAFSHSLQLGNRVSLRAGLPQMDRLRGDGGGVSRQNARLMLDARRGRWGANATARWREGYRTRRAGGRDRSDDLVLASFTAVDLRLSFQMSSGAPPSADAMRKPRPRGSDGLQLNLDVENLFDARQEARLGDGSIAPGYGRDIQDPIGRRVRVTLQRRF